ncbi:hypothetical protein HF086_014165 [Spodoptera exigua]|uniref:Uncharacterized protein n=1 Tax=Spodoptera exigua TaxID=7107 RepID=A0A922N2V9_SPOEX|nr:hypothetical protein HF086_014165 [Spodoptera exigua]
MPKPKPLPPTQPPTLERTPKCYPETAVAYFLPAPPSPPKITVLKPDCKDLPLNWKKNVKENNIFKETPSNTVFPPRNEMSNRVSFAPPPPCSIGLPDLIDEIPHKIQNRLSRLAETEEEAPVCESCSALLKKLPIFNFDQELLGGFLAGIGIEA